MKMLLIATIATLSLSALAQTKTTIITAQPHQEASGIKIYLSSGFDDGIQSAATPEEELKLVNMTTYCFLGTAKVACAEALKVIQAAEQAYDEGAHSGMQAGKCKVVEEQGEEIAVLRYTLLDDYAANDNLEIQRKIKACNL